MVDKFRKTAPIKITFAQSEQPTAEKMSALSIQARNGLKLIEKAVGDIWNQSGDSLLHEYPLQISNLARIIGEQKYINPAIYPLQYTFKYKEVLGTKYRGYNYGYLKFKPKTGSTFAAYNASGQFTTFCANEYDVDGTNEYFVSTTTGKWRTNEELVGGSEALEYQVDPSADWLSDAKIFPSIIPDPRHLGSTFTGCRLSKVSGHYYLYLPPRRPIFFTSGYGSLVHGRPSQYPDDADIGLAYGNEATTLDINNLRYWQSDTVDAMAHKHYRYALPLEIYNLHSSMGLGTEYPANTIYLWDQAEQTVLEGVVFRKPYDAGFTDQPWVIEISSSNTELVLDDYLSSPDNESHAAYDSTGLTLITCGNSITRSLYTLSMQFLQHKHDGSSAAMDTHIDHKTLAGHNPPKDSVYTHNGRYPSAIPAWPQSRYLNDDHTYLLSRTGSQGIGSTHRDENDNAMLGNLVIANSVANAGGVFLDPTCANNSFKIAFGSNSGSYIRGESGGLINVYTNHVTMGAPVQDEFYLELNKNTTGSRNTFLRFYTNDATNYTFGIQRGGGANGQLTINQTGTGDTYFQTGGNFYLYGTSFSAYIATNPAKILLSSTVSSGTTSVEVGAGTDGDRISQIDLLSSGNYETVDYSTRIRKASGANGVFSISTKGTGGTEITNENAAAIVFKTSNADRLHIDDSSIHAFLDLIPNTDSSSAITLGDVSHRWQQGWFGDNLILGSQRAANTHLSVYPSAVGASSADWITQWNEGIYNGAASAYARIALLTKANTQHGTGSIGASYGLSVNNEHSGAGTIGTQFGIYIYRQTGAGSGVVNNSYGIYINAADFAVVPTENYGIYVANQGSRAGDFALYTSQGNVRLANLANTVDMVQSIKANNYAMSWYATVTCPSGGSGYSY